MAGVAAAMPPPRRPSRWAAGREATPPRPPTPGTWSAWSRRCCWDPLEDVQIIGAEAVPARNETAAQLAESAVNLLDQYPDEAQRLNDCTAVLNEAAATQPSN